MKTYRIQLTAEEQKKLEQVLKRLGLRDVRSYVVKKIYEDWLAVP
jgi:hypothetical protein